MQQTWFMVIAILCCLGPNDTLGIWQTCQPQPTCSKCLRSPGCAWCKQKVFLKSGESNERRCDSPESLRSRKCENVINPKSEMEFRMDKPLSSEKDDVIQLKPQSIEVKLRIGQPEEFKVLFQRAEGYPIDLYYLMDLSFSMKDDLDKIKNLGQDILTTLHSFTSDRHIGFGSFVDKVALPYVSQQHSRLANPCPSRLEKCQPAFSFRNILPLTNQAKRFKEEVSKQNISGNLDSPEAGLDAIMQAAVCRNEIGWRNVTSILVYTSDDTFHMAGDGRLAGIYRPHDGQCHLDSKSAYEGTLQDYPSIGHLSTVLQSNNMQLIFAVTEEIYPAYKALSELIPHSVVGVLKNDSSNVVELISDAYRNLSASIVFEHEQAPAGLSISYRSSCEGGKESNWSTRGECNGIKLNQQVEFTVRLNATDCLTKNAPISIKVQGINAVLTVYVETICDCDCEDRQENSSHCNYNGTFHCGMCSCDDKHLGQMCECQLIDDFDSIKAMSALCRQTNNSDICNGHGHCECGKCACHNQYRGPFCECDDNSCPQANNKMCNGKGSCNCSTCMCDVGYSGEKCHCPPEKERDCWKEGGTTCSGHGQCPCDHCICNEGMTGKYCHKVEEPCGTIYQYCTLCAVHDSKYPGVDCDKACHGLTTVKMAGPQEYDCVLEGLTFYIEVTNDGNIKIHHADLPSKSHNTIFGSVDKTSVIIGSSVTGIVVIGIVIIIVYRLLVELYDLREYRSFLRAQEQTDWKHTQNPLFQGATTTVMNPLHDGVE
ncbi:integrin beta-7-like isoform X1 [Alosa pseudoharengus]|uniref:integrin beta-7-like isoform X1 n=1 Tax=Alosa pseudoharengus TaxID=34774 RepID=UPI003F8BB184